MQRYVETLYPGACLPSPGPEDVAGPEYTFFVARADGEALGCAALREDAEGYCEIKRMFVLPEARGRGVARALLAAVEREAAKRGYAAIRLHTAKAMTEAIALYRRAGGYRDREPFWIYSDSEMNLFMEKELAP
jgi:putative acetyltransferase